METGLIVKILSLLAKGTYFLRPAKVTEAPGPWTVSVTGDVASLRKSATLSRGVVLWFAEGRHLRVPLPPSLSSGTTISIRAPGSDAVFEETQKPEIVIDIKSVLAHGARTWRNGDQLEFAVKVPCQTSDLLAFLSGETGKRDPGENNTMVTRFIIRKKDSVRDWAIENYEWRKELSTLAPISRVTVIKNHQEVPETVVQVMHLSNKSLPSQYVTIDRSSVLSSQDSARNCHTSSSQELLIRLSLSGLNDEVTILLEHPNA
jgi:hypothetical protein